MVFTRLILAVTFLFVKLMVIDMKIVGVNELGRRVGEDHQHAKLTNHDVDLIRQLREESDLSYKELAAKFDVSKGTIADVIKCRRRAQYPINFKRVG